MSTLGSKLGYAVRQRSFQIALAVWIAISIAAVVLCQGTMPLPIGPHPGPPVAMVISSWIALIFLALEVWLVAFIARRRAMPDLAARAPADRSIALRETLGLWFYGAIVLLVGRF